MLVERSGLGQVMTGSPQVCTTAQCQADLAAINTPSQSSMTACPTGSVLWAGPTLSTVAGPVCVSQGEIFLMIGAALLLLYMVTK